MRSLIYWELLDESQLWWCNVEESFCRVIKIPWSTSHCHRLNHDDEPECKNKKIFPCSVNAETQDVLSSQRCEAEEDSVVVLDSRYYSFTWRPILENHFVFLLLSWSFVKLGQKRQGITEKRRGKDSNSHLDYFFAVTALRPMRSRFWSWTRKLRMVLKLRFLIGSITINAYFNSNICWHCLS